MEGFPRLFEPLAFGSQTLRNRITVTAHATNLSPEGAPGAADCAYYARRAQGGAALLVTEGMAVHPTGLSGQGTWRAYDEALVSPLTALAEAVHAEGAVLVGQLRHNGRQMRSQPGGPPLWAASAIPSSFFRETPHAMDLDEIEEVKNGFVLGARHARRAGLDGIEINAAHGFLLHGFLSPWANQRNDAFGGSETNRWRLLLDVCGAVRAEVGASMCLGVRLSAEDGSPGGMDWPMVARLAQALAGTRTLTYVSLSHSDFEPWSMNAMVPDEITGVPDVTAMAHIRQAVPGLPVLVAGGIRDPQTAERLLADGAADLVGMTRALIADPDLPRKVQQGQLDGVRPCIACNDCWAAVGKGSPLRCTVAPEAGQETAVQPAPSTARRVVVVGGGVAGLYAARAAARRGCQVTLLEADARLGGQARLIAQIHGRDLVGRLVAWLRAELDSLGVTVKLDPTATPQTVLALQPDVVIVAVGAGDPVPPLFVGTGPVFTSAQLIARGSAPPVCVVVDGDHGLEALSVAEQIARWGSSVTLVTEQLAPGGEAPSVSVPAALGRLRKLGVAVLTAQRVLGYARRVVTLEDVLTLSPSSIGDVDEVIVTGRRVARVLELDTSIGNGQVRVLRVGDCVAPRTLAHAIRDGHNAGARI